MYKKKKIVALIPARGGSKGLPGKNIKPLRGKPLIAWTIEQAKKSKYIDRIIVSTEDDEICAIAKKYGADIPFTRPKYLAKNNTKMIEVLLHAISHLEEKREYYDLMMLLQPTSPLRLSADIDESVKLLFKKRAEAIISVSQVDHNPYWTNILPGNGCMKNFMRPDATNRNRQEFPDFYRINGAIYLAYCDYLKKNKKFWGNKTYAFVMPAIRSIDIDTILDFKIAELIKTGIVDLPQK